MIAAFRDNGKYLLNLFLSPSIVYTVLGVFLHKYLSTT